MHEVAHAREAGQHARQLVAVQHAVLGQAQRQVAVRPQPRPVDERRLGAVHRLEAEPLPLDVDQVHVVAVQRPVPGLLPQLLVHKRRRVDLLVPAPLLELAHRAPERLVQPPPLGVPERRAGRDVVEAEQVELHAQATVVALLRLLASPQVLVELLLRLPDRAVDALHRRARLVAAPVGARDREQLERPDLPGGLDVGPAAQVVERPVLVERRDGRGLAGGLGLGLEVVEDLDLEVLSLALDDRPRLVERQLLPDERVVRLHALPHARLDPLEVVGRGRPRQLEVVVEAVVDRGPDAELRAREQVEDRLGHDVRGAVAHRVDGRVGARVQELLGRAALGRLEAGLVVRQLVVGRDHRRGALVVRHRRAPENHRTSRPDRTRGSTSRGSTRLHGRVARRGAAVRSCRANGRIPGRFAGRSRVVPTSVVSVGACSRWPRLSGDVPMGRVPLDALCLRPLGPEMVGDTGLEPVTSCMSSMRSNQLS